MKNRKIMLSFFILLLVITFSFTFCTKVNAANLGWKKLPVSVYADTRLSNMEISQLKEAINAWNSTKFGTFFIYSGEKTEKQLIPMSGVVTVSKGPLSLNGETVDSLARTAFNRHGYMEKATMILNTNYTFNNGTTSSGEFYLKSVFMHELFHALGFLDHSIYSNSFFYEKYNGSTKFLPTDLQLIDTLY